MRIFKGRWYASFAELPPLASPESFLRRPCIRLADDYDVGKSGKHATLAPGGHMVEEARIYEILKQHPHPNICVYYGCVRGSITLPTYV
jgi:hypothetical protein